MSVYLRPYRTSDLNSLYLLDTLCFEPPFRFSRASMRLFAQAENAIVRLACEQEPEQGTERLAGFCIVHLEEAGAQLAGYVVTLDVDPTFRRQGLGPALMRSVETSARDAGAQIMALHVWAENEPAIRLYERLGYAYLDRASGFYGEGLDALLYRKLLSADRQAPSSEAEEQSEDWSADGGSSKAW